KHGRKISRALRLRPGMQRRQRAAGERKFRHDVADRPEFTGGPARRPPNNSTNNACPLHPRKRACAVQESTSAKGQKRTSDSKGLLTIALAINELEDRSERTRPPQIPSESGETFVVRLADWSPNLQMSG